MAEMAKPSKIIIFGATSAIAYEVAKYLAREGVSLYLCARDREELCRLSQDLQVRGAKQVEHCIFDALKPDSIDRAIKNCLKVFPDLDGLFIAHGLLPDQSVCETDAGEIRKIVEINFTSAAKILTEIADHFEKQAKGTIVVISSIAGDRGKQSNYVYGATKSALTVFLQGMRQRLHKSGVKVITIKPGFVDTPMTKDFEKGKLWASSEQVGKGIYRAISKKQDIVYLPFFWQIIMILIKSVPERIFKNLSM